MSRSTASPPVLFRIYQTATRLLAPIAYRVVTRKLKRHDVAPQRLQERRGIATEHRPNGRLVWFHAASVGESLSVLTLITEMGKRLPDTEFLITSGTATSASLIARRIPPRTRHQFLPIDAPSAVNRFYDHWSPDAGVFVESELWPNLIVEGARRSVPLVLLNARLSEKSVGKWKKAPATARFILDQFNLILTQNLEIADRLKSVGAGTDKIRVGTNLKATSAPLPVDQETLAEFRTALGTRPVWVASSTHPGEEEIVLAAHARLLETYPDLCLILIPRHPERGDEVENLVQGAGQSLARRTRSEALTSTIQVYLADTLGETGTWYALTPLVFLGGSLKPNGGHNPYEVAQAGAAVVTGPHIANFTETYDPLLQSGGAVSVEDSNALAACIDHWLDNPAELDDARSAARAFVSSQQGKLSEVISTLCHAVGLDKNA